MNSPLDFDALRELLPDYALGLLEGDDLARMTAALQADSTLRAELDAYHAVLGALSVSVPQLTPPPELREKVLRQAQPKRLIFFPRRAWALVAAAASLLVGLAAVVLLLRGSDELSTKERIAAITTDERTTWVQISGTEDHPELSGKFGIAPDGKAAVLKLSNLALLEPSQAYQLWLVRGEERLSGHVWRPEKTEAEVLIKLPDDFQTYQAIGLTVEPKGGSPSPTSPPIFITKLWE